MKRMDRTLRVSALILALLLFLAACEEYDPAVKDPTGTLSQETSSNTDASAETDPTGEPFTVTVLDENGERYISPDAPLTVKWSDGYSVFEAAADESGIASIQGLDGDYAVTLKDLPDGYAYNPNIYEATNDERDVTIQLHKLIQTEGQGEQKYQSIEVKELGVYCVEITSEKQEVFYHFAPAENGRYTVESWVDITADTVNPTVKYYGANASYKEYRYTKDDGGVSAAYTRNFILDLQIADENISENGASVFTFGVMAGSKSGEYPVKVYFTIRRTDDFIQTDQEAVLIFPKETLVKQPDYPGYTFVGAESETVTFDDRKIFDGSRFKLWEKSDGGDGYYHLYDSETDTYGPILYAKISDPCRFMGNAFTKVEEPGNKSLTLSGGTENYKLFIEGFAQPNSETVSQNPNGKPPYFCTMDCPCRNEGTNDSMEILGIAGACYDTCDDAYCQEHCRHIPSEYPAMMGMEGYGTMTNSDGCYAVTQELKEFLQKYSESQFFFKDGNGFVETHETISVYADEDDQWLFACGYYVLDGA